ncbi:sensor histidine kinase [Aromatoleum toluvorans]|uniref:histidine kinase n=1 Tax=Aromatoleum toluvorans TaxID=92002 RepID=A0ABX1Q0C1_9RHOO|nr:ATP-binding protein [Aromatoleum toluvorans]NMG45134.1 sensor histidine kinase [Aromatoleum toluvorans]
MIRSRSLVLLLFCLVLVGLSGYGAYRVAQRLGVAELQATGLHRLDLYAASLEREISKYAFLPGTLNLQQSVLDLLVRPSDGAAVERVNAYLEQLNERAGTLSIFVMDTRGKVLAASNWRRPDSFVGEDLSFRPYFRDAMTANSGRFFGIGTTRGEPGYYLAAMLTGEHEALGVAVVKVSLEQLEKSWSTVEAPVLVADENGVVILSAVAGWKFTTLRPLDDKTRAAFDHTQQYNRRALQPLGVRDIEDYGPGTRLVRIAAEGPATVSVYPVSGRFLAQARALPGTPWTLTVMSQLEQVDSLAQSRAALAAIATACLCMLGVIVADRRRHLRHRLAAREALQKAHDELERKVEERTVDLSATNQKLQAEVAERIRAERTLRAAQDELVQAGKLAVIGQLSTGIAHELNQPLAALRTLSTNAGRFLERGDAATARANLDRIADLADRMGRITGQLRNFARRSSGLSEPVRLCHAIDNALGLLEARLRRSAVEVEWHCPTDDEPVAMCDANRLEQVLVNLIGNALDAMAGQDRPRLELRCERADGVVRLQVRDHGPGLSDEVQPHLFEPFFTTKPAGEGLGLGLAISAGIVRDFGGSLQGANQPDGGAVFTLELPLAPAP